MVAALIASPALTKAKVAATIAEPDLTKAMVSWLLPKSAVPTTGHTKTGVHGLSTPNLFDTEWSRQES